MKIRSDRDFIYPENLLKQTNYATVCSSTTVGGAKLCMMQVNLKNSQIRISQTGKHLH